MLLVMLITASAAPQTHHLKMVLLEVHPLLVAPDLRLEDPSATRRLLFLLYRGVLRAQLLFLLLHQLLNLHDVPFENFCLLRDLRIVVIILVHLVTVASLIIVATIVILANFVAAVSNAV